MPAGDGTGPDGRGGWCTPLLESGQIDKPIGGYGGFGRGAYGGGFGRGRGFRRMYYSTGKPYWTKDVTIRDEGEQLTTRANANPLQNASSDETTILKERIKDLEKRLEELEKK